MAWRFRHALGDGARGLFALVYWNARKQLFRRRGGRCPCQNESDDPIPGRVRCDAVLHWHSPGRFRAVCPLLVATPEGWRCSAAPREVRPFWARAAALLAAGVALLYLVMSTGIFAGLRLVSDAPVTWWQVAWPARWQEIPAVQSRHLLEMAMASFRDGRPEAARLALEAARERNPGNFPAGLLLAQVAMFQRSYLFADGLFAGLLEEHPEQRLRTAIVYHDTLLGTDRMGALALWSLDMARRDLPRAAVWVRSALLAVQSLPPDAGAELLDQLRRRALALAPHARRLLEAEFDWRAGRRDEARERLRQTFPGPYNPFYVGYQIARLAECGDPGAAQVMLDQLGPLLGRFEHLRLQVIVAGHQGDEWGQRAAFASLLRGPLTAEEVERVAALDIAVHEPGLHRLLSARVRERPELRAAVGAPAMVVAALACGDRGDAKAWVSEAAPGTLGPLADLARIDFGRRDPLQPDTVLHLVNLFSLPREVVIALMWRMKPGVNIPSPPPA